MELSNKTRETISQIASGDIGYISKAVTCAIKTLDEIVQDESLPEAVRNKAAFAAANLHLSDHED
ncbi:YaeP family protein [Motilimonas cestriensis]|uniref:YaeP family protein n=1 Tax=Motilimonas cestriensis TaxID=2742685 RepID=A0ABS8WA46_9GAMM|nr:YaeP family protein [Motilimonas cestriensis]MCE2595360.1 YaeP family protein [Motilimonas cestriensis]